VTLRIAVAAAGSHIFQAAHIPAIEATGTEVVGVFDVDAARAAVAAERFGCPVVPDLPSLLAVPADAVVVCAPHPLHAGIIRESLRAGRAVLVEKPLAPRLTEVDEIIAASAATRLPVGVIHQHRLRDDVVAARRMLRDGALGRMHRAVLVASYPKRSVYYTDTPWRGTWAGEGGGVLLNQGLHDIDLLVHLLGLPARVTGSLRTAVHPIEAEDAAELLLEWRDGMTASVHVTSAAALDGNRLELHGSRGSLRLSARGLERRAAAEDFDTFAAAPGGHFDAFPVEEWRRTVPPGRGDHAEVYADFAEALAQGRAPRTDAQAARGAVEVIAAAALASHAREWVALPVDPARADALLDARIARATADRREETPVPGGAR